MAWPTSYKSSYWPKLGDLGWSTRHLIAEQTDDVVELAERRANSHLYDTFAGLIDQEDSDCSSTSIVSLDLEQVPAKDSVDPVSAATKQGQQHGSERHMPTIACGVRCWAKHEFEEPASLLPCFPGTVNSTANVEQSIYKRLDPSSMRLLNVLPASSRDPIECTLIENVSSDVSQEEPMCKYQNAGDSRPPHRYEALSYTWGPLEPTQVIHVSNANNPTQYLPVAVRSNLYLALRHLRHEKLIRTLWVDALCINQGDTEEKNHQVRGMRGIFSNASRVIVWLGGEADESHIAMKTIDMFDKKDDRKCFFGSLHDQTCFATIRRIYNALICLYERQWFSRAWIWQEIMVAQDIIVQCGSFHTSWKPLKRASRRLRQVEGLLPQELTYELRPRPETRLSLLKMLKHRWIFGVSIMGYCSERSSVYELHAGGPLELMFISRLLNASDQRDKVYAFLGLARVRVEATASTKPQLNSKAAPNPSAIEDSEMANVHQGNSMPRPYMVIDYNLSVIQVYEQFTKYMINKYRTLDILCVLNTYPPQDSGAPTWMPDWRENSVKFEPRPEDNLDYLTNRYATAGITLAEMQDSADWSRLEVTGCYIDEIDALLPFSTNVYGARHVHFRLLENSEDDLEYGNKISSTLESCHVDDPQTFKRFHPATSDDLRRCARTTTGRMCLVSRWTHAGDSIWILQGACLPFVMFSSEKTERQSQVSGSRKCVRQTAGPCFAPDMVDGSFYNHYFPDALTTAATDEEGGNDDRPVLQQLTLI